MGSWRLTDKKVRGFAVILGVAVIALTASDASAMYNSALGRWMQRDPGIPDGVTGPVQPFYDNVSEARRRWHGARAQSEVVPRLYSRAMSLVSGAVREGHALNSLSVPWGWARDLPAEASTDSAGNPSDMRELWARNGLYLRTQYMDGGNLSQYVGSRPVTYFDPSGLVGVPFRRGPRCCWCVPPAGWNLPPPGDGTCSPREQYDEKTVSTAWIRCLPVTGGPGCIAWCTWAQEYTCVHLERLPALVGLPPGWYWWPWKWQSGGGWAVTRPFVNVPC